jgi:hypothetical protein
VSTSAFSDGLQFGSAERRVGTIRASLMSARTVHTPKSNPSEALPTSRIWRAKLRALVVSRAFMPASRIAGVKPQQCPAHQFELAATELVIGHLHLISRKSKRGWADTTVVWVGINFHRSEPRL